MTNGSPALTRTGVGKREGSSVRPLQMTVVRRTLNDGDELLRQHERWKVYDVDHSAACARQGCC